MERSNFCVERSNSCMERSGFDYGAKWLLFGAKCLEAKWPATISTVAVQVITIKDLDFVLTFWLLFRLGSLPYQRFSSNFRQKRELLGLNLRTNLIHLSYTIFNTFTYILTLSAIHFAKRTLFVCLFVCLFVYLPFSFFNSVACLHIQQSVGLNYLYHLKWEKTDTLVQKYITIKHQTWEFYGYKAIAWFPGSHRDTMCSNRSLCTPCWTTYPAKQRYSYLSGKRKELWSVKVSLLCGKWSYQF